MEPNSGRLDFQNFIRNIGDLGRIPIVSRKNSNDFSMGMGVLLVEHALQ